MLTDDVAATVHLALRSVDALARRIGAGGEAVSVGALLRELQAAREGPAKDRLTRARQLRCEVKDLLDEALRCATEVDGREELASVEVPRAVLAALEAALAGLDACRVEVDAALGSAGEVSARLRVVSAPARTSDEVDALLLKVEGVLGRMGRHAAALAKVLVPLADWSDEHDGDHDAPEAVAALRGALGAVEARLRRGD